MISIVSILAVYLVAARRLDYTDAYVVFALPWLMIVAFSLVHISALAKPIHRATYEVLLIALFTGMLPSGKLPLRLKRQLSWKEPRRFVISAKLSLLILDGTFYLLTVLNVLIAGYVPLIRGIMTGYTGYTEFGVHGLYGFYLAFANAIAIFYWVLFLRTGRKQFLLRYAVVLLVFVLFVTRQNLLSTIVETLIVHSVVSGKITWRRLIPLLAIAAVGFSLLGLLRSGNIKEIAQVDKRYMWVPDSVIWIYAYSYFNIANVDNLILFSHAPYFNGSSLANLIPSFLRPWYDMGDYLQSINFNVSSYLFPVYEDLGKAGVIAVTFIALAVTKRVYAKITLQASLYSIGTFAVLYFCAAFSFFVNFWFYLPVIFQIAFFRGLSNLNSRAVDEYNLQRLKPQK